MQSDYSYLDRLICNIVALLFMIHRMSVTGAFRFFTWTSLKRVELKLVTILLLLISLILIIVYDCIAATIKYREGYWVDPVTGLIMTRPLQRYDSANMRLFPSIAVIMNLSWSMQSTAFFMLMAMWNHLSKAIINRKFMSSIEFKACALYSVISLGAFPFLQLGYYLSGDYKISTLVPIGLHAFQCILLIILSQIANYRFRRLLRLMPMSTSTTRVVYYQSLNNFLSIALFFILLGLTATLVDALTIDALAYNKLLGDIFLKIFNLGFTLTYPIAILIICPPNRIQKDRDVKGGRQRRNMDSPPETPTSATSTTNMLVNRPSMSSEVLSECSSPTWQPRRSPVPHLKRDTRGYFTTSVRTSNISTNDSKNPMSTVFSDNLSDSKIFTENSTLSSLTGTSGRMRPSTGDAGGRQHSGLSIDTGSLASNKIRPHSNTSKTSKLAAAGRPTMPSATHSIASFQTATASDKGSVPDSIYEFHD